MALSKQKEAEVVEVPQATWADYLKYQTELLRIWKDFSPSERRLVWWSKMGVARYTKTKTFDGQDDFYVCSTGSNQWSYAEKIWRIHVNQMSKRLTAKELEENKELAKKYCL